ncbi:MAG: SIMPL domain-containing protein [bacterium]
MFKKTSFVVLIILLVLVTWFFLIGGYLSPAEELSSTSREETEVNVNYESRMEFSPERARINLAVETNDREMEKAFSENNEQMEKVQAVLNEKDLHSLETKNFRINTRTRRNEEGSEEEIYYITNQLEIETNKLSEISMLITDAVDAGANRVDSINYLLEDETEARREVIQKGIRGLEEKAQYITDSMEQDKFHLKKLNINEGQFVGPLEYNMEGREIGDSSSPVINPQDIEIKITLQGEYVIY